MKRLLIELGILTLIGIAAQFLFTHGVYPALGLPSNGPVPIRSLIIVVVISLFLKKHDESWSDYGLKQPFKHWQFFLIVIGLFLSNLLLVQNVKDWIRGVFKLPPTDYSFFEHIHGSELALIIWLIIVWLAAAFGEEMIFRGYLLKRFQVLFKDKKIGFACGIIFQATIFGFGHAYAGLGTAVAVGFGALVTGSYLLLTKRSIWPLIIIHGLWDSLAFILFYLNGKPST